MRCPTSPDYLGDTFIEDVAEHQLTILNDQGIYRHLRFQRPGTGDGKPTSQETEERP